MPLQCTALFRQGRGEFVNTLGNSKLSKLARSLLLCSMKVFSRGSLDMDYVKPADVAVPVTLGNLVGGFTFTGLAIYITHRPRKPAPAAIRVAAD
jgi:hypothetical protein